MKSVKFINIRVLFLLCSLLYLVPPVLADDSILVEQKDWREYTQEQKASFSARWKGKDIEAVRKALIQGTKLPDFVNWLPPHHAECDSSADLRAIPLDDGFLDGAHLSCMCLQGALLRNAKIRHAYLSYANMQGAEIDLAKFEATRLRFSDLQDAHAWKVNFERADLGGANLQRAYLINANFQDADLFETYFDSTYLCQVDLGEAKNIRYIVWGDSVNNRYVIGREKEIKTAQDFLMVENTYRDIKTWYQKELLNDIAAQFHYRENEVVTKRYLRSNKPWEIFWGLIRYVFLRLTYGYGSQPIWLLRDSFIVVLAFGFLFAIITRLGWKQSSISFVQSRIGKKEKLKPIGSKHLI